MTDHPPTPTTDLPRADARPLRVLKFTDTFADINGVCRFIQNIAQTAHDTGRDLTVFTSTRIQMPPVCERIDNVVNFEPIYARKMPGYETLDLAIPPMIQMLRAAEEFAPDVIHISTPGPVGTTGMIAAMLMRTPIVGVYHTDFPAYIDELFDNRFCSWACRAYMGLFYRRFRFVFSRSADYANRLRAIGLREDKLVRLQAGYDDTQFDHTLRDPRIWKEHGIAGDSIKAVFCGRVSTEKNLPMLVRIWPQVRQRVREMGREIELVIIGDGPYRKQMQRELADQGAHYLGFRHGEELAALYASCDFFVFPSTTDTLGQVVMEAQASGLPVIITDQGGPKEIVHTQHDPSPTAVVLSVDDEPSWIDTIVDLATNDDQRRAMGAAGIDLMKQYTFTESFKHYWQIHEAAPR
ncbi:MAG: glycosyltransferase family 1 protein [Phycisphaerales bacterium]